MSGGAHVAGGGPPKSRSVVVIVVVALVAAVVALAGVYVWRKPAAQSPVAQPTAAVTTTSSPAPSPDSARLFARRMYLEQVQSGANIGRLAEGKITSFDIAGRKVVENTATVGIIAHFVDGSSAPGKVVLVKEKGSWFFFSMEGDRSATSTGFATGVASNRPGGADPYAGVPDSAVDWDLAGEMVRRQTTDQEYIKAVVEGPASRYVLQSPKTGAGTVDLDSTVYSAKGGTPEKVRIILVPGTFEGRSHYFIVGMESLSP